MGVLIRVYCCQEITEGISIIQPTALHSMHVYEVRRRKNHRGVDLISDSIRHSGLRYSFLIAG